jgi:hypothetical protein
MLSIRFGLRAKLSGAVKAIACNITVVPFIERWYGYSTDEPFARCSHSEVYNIAKPGSTVQLYTSSNSTIYAYN